ncbi:unnamed protein product [Trichogramma brassicae]|uniref:PHD-type domain-containing protein n=1 Tax=Trichogramma brassicae TaxID=86971 RepID=A0A6H5IYK2_9HYME|nr:unnamed protein product [Trichogramma brassicae]
MWSFYTYRGQSVQKHRSNYREDEVEESGAQVAGAHVEGSTDAEENPRPEEDDDYEPEERKKKKGKKRKGRSEDKRGKKKKKKKKSESGDGGKFEMGTHISSILATLMDIKLTNPNALQESDYGGGAVAPGADADMDVDDSDYTSNRKSRKSSSRKSNHGAAPSTPAASTQSQEPSTGMPTVDEVCNTFGLQDVPIEYTDADFQNLTTYKLFQQHVRPLLSKENPKVPISKLMMLVAAKWRDFSEMNPHTQPEVDVSTQSVDEDRNSRSNRSAMVQEDEEDEEDDDSDRKKKSRSSRMKKGKKASKVPTLKIKLGKRRRGSSDDEVEGSGQGSDRDSDMEFEQMLADAEDVPPENDAKSNEANNEAPVDPPPRKKAKTKFGNKSKKKKSKKAASKFPDGETDHQDYCEVCQQGGEIILCDTCPRAYHLVCLEPELEETPEGKWSCPHFAKMKVPPTMTTSTWNSVECAKTVANCFVATVVRAPIIRTV